MPQSKETNRNMAASYNKAYALHSLAVVRATPHRAKDRATSHKQNDRQNVASSILPIDGAGKPAIVFGGLRHLRLSAGNLHAPVLRTSHVRLPAPSLCETANKTFTGASVRRFMGGDECYININSLQ